MRSGFWGNAYVRLAIFAKVLSFSPSHSPSFFYTYVLSPPSNPESPGSGTLRWWLETKAEVIFVKAVLRCVCFNPPSIRSCVLQCLRCGRREGEIRKTASLRRHAGIRKNVKQPSIIVYREGSERRVAGEEALAEGAIWNRGIGRLGIKVGGHVKACIN